MSSSRLSQCLRRLALVLPAIACGCATYSGVVKPVPRLGALSPELEQLTDKKIETFLASNAEVSFPTVLAVAKVKSIAGRRWYRSGDEPGLLLETIHGDEARGWESFTKSHREGDQPIITQVQFVSPLLVSGDATLKNLRDAAARLHAPLLLAYTQVDRTESGYNEAAIVYWTIVGWFLVPGHTVGHHSVCQGVLVDTRTGSIVSTIQSEGKDEEYVIGAALSIARKRIREKAHNEAVTNLHSEFKQAVVAVATRSVAPSPSQDRTDAP